MRQPALVTAVVAAAALSLTACGSGDKAAASAPSTVKATSSSSAPTTPNAPVQAAPVTVTQQPASTVTRTVAPAPTVTETHVAAAPAPAANSGSGAGNVGGCSYNGVSIVTNHLSCGFAQNVIAAYLSGSSTAYSPATGRSYTFSCDGGYVTRCESDGTSSSIQNGGYLLW